MQQQQQQPHGEGCMMASGVPEHSGDPVPRERAALLSFVPPTPPHLHPERPSSRRSTGNEQGRGAGSPMQPGGPGGRRSTPAADALPLWAGYPHAHQTGLLPFSPVVPGEPSPVLSEAAAIAPRFPANSTRPPWRPGPLPEQVPLPATSDTLRQPLATTPSLPPSDAGTAAAAAADRTLWQLPSAAAAAAPAAPASSPQLPAPTSGCISGHAPPPSPRSPELRPPSSPASFQPRPGGTATPLGEADRLLQQARQQQTELWRLADQLMGVERARSRSAERQLWDARCQQRHLERRLAEAEAACVAGQAAREAQAALEAALREGEERRRGVEAALASVQGLADRARQAAQAELASLAAQLEQQQLKLGELGREAAALRQQTAAAEASAAVAEQRCAALSAEVEQGREEGARQRAAAEAQQAQAAAEAGHLTEQLSQARTRAEHMEVEIADALARLEGKEASLQAAALARRGAEQQAAALGREREQLLSQLDEADLIVRQLSSQLSTLTAAEEGRQRELAAAAAAAAAAAQEGEAAAARLQEAQRQGAAAQQLLRERAEELEATALEVRQLRLAVEEARQQGARAQREAAALRLGLEQAQGEKAEALEEVQMSHAELVSLHAALADAQLRLQCFEGSDEAYRAQSLPELEALVAVMERAVPRLRNALTERRIEAARSEMAAASQLTCIVCCANQRDTFLNCGHLICRHCSERMASCPICRTAITSRTRAFV